MLVEGVEIVGQTDEEEVPPAHPDRPDDRESGVGDALLPGRARLESWGRQNVYDVYSLSGAIALDGTKYKDW